MKSFTKIIQDIQDNGILTLGTQEELENEFEFEASERGWTDEEIAEALASPNFPKL